ncbi:ABC transporter ATP-binding protein [Mycoplasmopsis ciconiae]|uniref:ABC transporter ATP-binding protein n=1 Tax=Mycoplasmopsis ciconiae TaxID=561067 RepID=A0ABU7MLJ2_9BACT|nr:ABC transporter ATP-binding protein [Mycoplasmopsis ciconiae]
MNKNKHLEMNMIKQVLKYLVVTKIFWFYVILLIIINAAFVNFFSWFVGFIFDKFMNPQTFNSFNLTTYLLFILILMIAYITSKFFIGLQGWIVSKPLNNLPYQLRDSIYSKIMDMPMSFFETSKTGDLISIITNDTLNLTQSISQFIFNFISIIFQFLIAAILMFLYAPILASIAIVIIPLSSVLFFYLISKSKKHYHKIQQNLGELNSYIEEIIVALPLIRIHQQQKQINKNFDNINKQQLKSQLKASIYSHIAWPTYAFIRLVNQLVIVSIGSYFYLNNIPSYGITPLNFGVITSFTLYIATITDQIKNVMNISTNIQKAFSSWNRIEKLINYPLKSNINSGEKIDKLNGNIIFKNVTFSYPNSSDVTVLKNINFIIEENSSLALVGHTGCGKSTITKLLSQIYLPTKGEVLINDKSSKNINERSWRSNIAMINQDIFLFEDTIMNNLKIVNSDISEEEIVQICKLTHVHDFIINMDKGYQTIIKNNGSNISQGQKQLLSITRALISKRSIVIMDEATSSIDTITEKYIENAINILMKKTTLIIVAHRLNTVKNAKQIIVLDHGKIVEKGNHKQLMDIDNGIYKQLYLSGFDNS